MLKQVADIEFPQMFKNYQFSSSFVQPYNRGNRLVLTIPRYEFRNFKAAITVHAVLYDRGEAVLLDRSYAENGTSQGAKMFWAGAFGMKSAIRQSSLTAYQKILEQLRNDLVYALNTTEKIQPATFEPIDSFDDEYDEYDEYP